MFDLRARKNGRPLLVGEQAADHVGRDAGDAFGPLGRVGFDALLQQLERGLDRRAVRELEVAEQEGVAALGVGDDRPVLDNRSR